MTAVDFQKLFNQISYTINTDNMVQTTWLRLGDADQIGTPGTTTFCGAVCKSNTFTITNKSTANR